MSSKSNRITTVRAIRDLKHKLACLKDSLHAMRKEDREKEKTATRPPGRVRDFELAIPRAESAKHGKWWD